VRVAIVAAIELILALCVTATGVRLFSFLGHRVAWLAAPDQIRRITAILYIPLAILPDRTTPPESPVWWIAVIAFALAFAWTIVKVWDVRLAALMDRIPGRGWTLFAAVLLVNLAVALRIEFGPYPAVTLMILLVAESYALIFATPLRRLAALITLPWSIPARWLRRRGVLSACTDLGLGATPPGRWRFSSPIVRHTGMWLLLAVVVLETGALRIQPPAKIWKEPWVRAEGFGHGYWTHAIGMARMYGPDGTVTLFEEYDLHWMDVRLASFAGGLATGDKDSLTRHSDFQAVAASISPSGRYACFCDPSTGAVELFRPAALFLDTLSRSPRVSASNVGWDEESRLVTLYGSDGRRDIVMRLGHGGGHIPIQPPGVPPPLDPEHFTKPRSR
jgi:hypothetical protein